jgi:hypothetical protein
MLITFRCESYADITMFGDVAKSLLKLMGHSTVVPGAILAEDVPAALFRLKNAIKADQSAMDTPINTGGDDFDGDAVSLATRAIPLIELLSAAAAAKCDVIWDQ